MNSTAGKPKFPSLVALTNQSITQPATEVTSNSDSEPKTLPVEEVVVTPPKATTNPVAAESKPKNGRIKSTEIPIELRNQIMEIVQQAAGKAAFEKLFGKRSTFKGPRVTRSYKIDLSVDKWLDAINEATGIEKSTLVTDAIREYIGNKYPQYKPEDPLSEM